MRLRARPLILCLFLLATFAATARAETSPDPRKVFEQLSYATIDPSKIYAVRNAQLARDRVRLYFNRGFLAFFGEANGAITGAAFSGDGEILLVPSNPVERQSLNHFIQSPILEERFTSAYLRFTDQTAQELSSRLQPPDPEASERPTGLADQWNTVLKRLNPSFSLRILQDLMGERQYPYFHAELQGIHLGTFQVTVDERWPEAVHVMALRAVNEKVFADVWYSSPSGNSAARGGALLVGSVRAHAYRIDTRLNVDHTLDGRAEVELESRSSADRVLWFDLSRRLKVTEVLDEQGQTLAFFQSSTPEALLGAVREFDSIAVVLEAAQPAGRRFRLTFKYQGNVIEEVGEGVFYVGARGSWYPNRGAGTRASYDMTFHYPEALTLVATGQRLEENSSEGWKHSRWVSDQPFPIAGFNLGAYDSRVHPAGRTTIEVYATSEVERALQALHAARRPPATLALDHRSRPRGPVTLIPGEVQPLEPAALLSNVAETAARAVRFFETLFGPFPYPRLAIAQIPGSFGQGWPELVYLPTLFFLPPAARSELGVKTDSVEVLSQVSLAHEIAHQWWGNQVGWKSYRDQWLSEGFSSYAAALWLEQEKGGSQKFRELLRDYKRDLLEKNEGGWTVESGGPIWLGQRLTNSRNPDGYTNIVYKKACWVLHMLRSLMRQGAGGSDDRFIKMLTEFLATYRGTNPSTEDFIRHAEKYMPRALNLSGDGTLNWFFDAWVYGTGIPTYELKATTRRVSATRYVVEGSIEPSSVSRVFEMLVPVVATLSKTRSVTTLVAVSASGGRFRLTTPTQPTSVAIDEDNLLAIVR